MSTDLMKQSIRSFDVLLLLAASSMPSHAINTVIIDYTSQQFLNNEAGIALTFCGIFLP